MYLLEAKPSWQLGTPVQQLCIERIRSCQKLFRIIYPGRPIQVSYDVPDDAGKSYDGNEVVSGFWLAQLSSRNCVVFQIEFFISKAAWKTCVAVTISNR